MKWHAQNMCTLYWKNHCIPSWKLEKMVTTFYQTINNKNIIFSNCLQIRYIFAIFVTFDDILVGKISTTLNQNSFSDNFGTGTFKDITLHNSENV